MPATKDEVLAETTTAWAEYSARLATVTDEDLCRLNSGHGWTLKDVVSHIAVWEREAVHVIQALVEGREIHDYADFDPWNERFYNEHKDTPIDQVRPAAPLPSRPWPCSPAAPPSI